MDVCVHIPVLQRWEGMVGRYGIGAKCGDMQTVDIKCHTEAIVLCAILVNLTQASLFEKRNLH